MRGVYRLLQPLDGQRLFYTDRTRQLSVTYAGEKSALSDQSIIIIVIETISFWLILDTSTNEYLLSSPITGRSSSTFHQEMMNHHMTEGDGK